ncbi:MAG: TrkH family potassium uptake protein [Gemmiger sp.]
MNYRMIAYVLGRIGLIEAALLVAPLVVSLLYGESTLIAWLVPIVLLVVLGGATGVRAPKDTTIFAREGLVVVAMSWVLLSVFGAIPFVLTGDIPFFVDAFFETVSGFTTTGSSILTDIEALHRSTAFWRSFTHWVGGMGVLVFAMAVLPMSDGRAMHLMRAEVPGPTVDKISSKLRDTAKILYKIYFVMTVLETVLLMLGGMPLYDALINAFGSAGTGGFSHLAASVGAYNNLYYEIVIGVSMLLFGINFNIYYLLLMRHVRDAFRSEELRVYVGIVAASVLAIAANIARMYGGFWQALRYSFFQVASIITTTGFATADFNQWPTFSRTVLVILMFFGACAGSTGGGFKISRVIILIKSSMRDIQRMLHPHAVTTVRFEGKPLDDKTVRGTSIYLTFYIAVFVTSVLLLSLDHFDLVTTFTAVTACFNNIGPGLNVVGPVGTFAYFSAPAKLLLSFDMLAGRLELYPMLVLFAPTMWLKRRRSKAVL